MSDGIYTALSGSLAQQHSLDVIANNVANASTAGFRGDRVVFGEMLAGAQANAAPNDPRQPAPLRTDQFVRVEQNQLDQTRGMMRQTGGKLDLALSGDGFFNVRTPQGDRLTRAGNFMMREDGQLTTSEGFAVIGQDDHPIGFPRDVKEIQIDADGTVRADGSDIGKLSIKTVSDPTQLLREGATTYAVKPGTTVSEAQDAQVAQGMLEASNVNPVNGLNDLITVNRTFDALQRVIQTFQEIDQRTARDVGSRTG
jgi:flagellar basal-body rod protein FlgF